MPEPPSPAPPPTRIAAARAGAARGAAMRSGALPVDRASVDGPRIGLALGGGGARGLAHVLMLEVFDEIGIRPTVITGTSIGALIGAAYASGLSAAEIRAHLSETLGDRLYLIRQLYGARSQPSARLLNLLPMRSALLDPLALLDLVLPSGIAADIKECQIPFRAVATDMLAKETTAFASGALKPRVAASIAIPVLFAPVTIDGRIYADGGLVNPLPVDIAAAALDCSAAAPGITIGIDVTGGRDGGALPAAPSVTTMLVHSVAVFQKTIIRQNLALKPPDIYVDLDLGPFGALQFNRIDEILAAGQPYKDRFRRQLERVLGVTQPACR